MEEKEDNSKRKNSILISRNSPIGLVVGVSGFLGSHLADALLDKNIQIIGIDNFSSGKRANLSVASKSNKFHLLSFSITESTKQLINLGLPRLDYAFFVADEDEELYSRGILNFLEYIRDLSVDLPKPTRVVLVTTIDLYGDKQDLRLKSIRGMEVKFAKFAKYYKLNARIIRLSSLYGPRMHFRQKDPMISLIQHSLLGTLQTQPTPQDFSTRALYITDAVNLIVKSVLSGSTAHKIYDGALLAPIKVEEIKQILLDPSWHELNNFQITQLPPWKTPNLEKTCRELSWKPAVGIIEALKNTLVYFKEHNIKPPQEEPNFQELGKRWSFKNMETTEETSTINYSPSNEKQKKESDKTKLFKKGISFWLACALIITGLIWPAISFSVGVLSIRSQLQSSLGSLSVGDFDKAEKQIASAKETLNQAAQVVEGVSVLRRVGLESQIEDLEQLVGITSDGVYGIEHTIKGSRSLYRATRIISGEEVGDLKPLYEVSQVELTTGSRSISRVKAQLSGEGFADRYPLIKDRISDLSIKINAYNDLVEKARSASFLLPQITAIDSKKSYLVLLQNNLEIRPGGGFIGSYAKLTFEKGRLSNIKVDDIYSLDGGLKDVITPPAEIKSDLNMDRFYLRDSNTEPDFPTSARQAEFFYKREAGELVQGVIALDLSASGKLLNAVGGLDLPEYGERVDGNNLFEKSISHAEVNFFPGSQAKKNYLTSLQTQLFNKIFYLSKQNWPGIIQAIGESLEQKHMMVYLADPALFSYLVSQNWAGILPRGVQEQAGETKDFLASVDSNMGGNKSNFYLDRSFSLKTSFSKEGEIKNELTLNYKNNSPSDVFPGGKYKNRYKLYLPLGSKLIKITFADEDITTKVSVFSDYGRLGLSLLLEIPPKESKSLVVEYLLPKPLSFKDGSVNYSMDLFKQAGTNADKFDWTINYPINFKLQKASEGELAGQEIKIMSNLFVDRSFSFTFTK